MNKKGFVSSSLIYSFIIVFIVLVAAIIGTYAYYQGLIFSSNREIMNSLNDRIEAQYVKLTNYLENSGFEYPVNPSSATYNTEKLAEIHYDGSKDYKLDSTMDGWTNDNNYSYRYIKSTRYSGDYALMLGNYNYSEIYQVGTQDNTYQYEVGIRSASRKVYQNITNLSVGTHFIYVSSKILRNRPTSGNNKINITCTTGCYTEGITTIDIGGEYVDWHQESILFKIEVTDEVNTITFSIDSNTDNSGVFILLDELLFTDVTSVIDATLWELDEAKQYFDGIKLNPDGTTNNRYKINYFEDDMSYELYEKIDRVTITFDNGEDVASTQMSVVAGKNLASIEIPTRENYTFLGYFTRPNGVGTRYFDRLGNPNEEEYFNKDMTLYAFWTNEIFYFPYTGSIVKVLITKPGDYRLEAWGAQGGSVSKNNNVYNGGYGAYSVGIVNIPYVRYLYLGIGGQGTDNFNGSTNLPASFNGGGAANCSGNTLCAGGGGATHIATSDGILSSLASNQSEILLVAGGGGGAIVTGNEGKNGGSGGGYIGAGATTTDNGGTQNSGFSFGQGESGNNYSGSGGGYYGGRVSSTKIGTGGSGYINNSKLVNKTMYCYHCETSNDLGTNTISTNSIYHVSDGEFEPLASSAKEGNGFVKITKIDNSLENYFELFFDGNGENSEVTPKSMWVLRNSIYGVLPYATRVGYEFSGWYTEKKSGAQIKETDTVTLTESQTLYAHWSLGEYVVTFDANGGDVTPINKTVTYTTNYGDLPTPTRAGYTFDGWYTDANSGTKITFGSIVTIGKNHTLYAHWKPNEYIITLDATGGTLSNNSISILYDSNYGVLPTPTKDQYNFIGWYTSKDGGTLITSNSIYKTVGNQTLYAHWSNRKYNFQINIDSHINTFNVKVGADAPLNNQTSYNQSIPYYTELIISNITTKTGYHYSGYTKNGAVEEIASGDSSTIKIRTPEGNASITLNTAPNTFTIKFSSGTGSGNMSNQTCSYDQNCVLSSNSFYKSGYTFSRWLGSNGKTYSNKQNVKNILSENGSSITLTAQWSKNSSSGGGSSGGGGGGSGSGGGTYTIRYHNVNTFGNDSKMGTTTCYVNSYCKLKKNVFTNFAWQFVGWLGPDNRVYADQASVYNLGRAGQTVTLTTRYYFPGLGYNPY